MSRLEYLDPKDWSLHVIDGESECACSDWILVPELAVAYIQDKDGLVGFVGNTDDVDSGEILWEREACNSNYMDKVKMKNYKIDVSMLSSDEKLDVLGKLVKIGYKKHHDDWKPMNIINCGYFVAYALPRKIEWDVIENWDTPLHRDIDVLSLNKLNALVTEKDGFISGVDALRALADGEGEGEEVEFRYDKCCWMSLDAKQ